MTNTYEDDPNEINKEIMKPLEERLLRLEQAVGAKAIKTTLENCVIDRNYFFKKTQL